MIQVLVVMLLLKIYVLKQSFFNLYMDLFYKQVVQNMKFMVIILKDHLYNKEVNH